MSEPISREVADRTGSVPDETERDTMSALNGDRARFRKQRMARLRRRERSRLAFAALKARAARARALDRSLETKTEAV
jgi:hypothetical protein